MIRMPLSILAISLLLLISIAPSRAEDDPALRAVLYGDGAVAFASGFIRDTPPPPIEGTVSQITGDNQTTGNRRLLGMGDTIYLLLKTPEDHAVGDLLTVYRQRHKVFHPATGKYLGYLYNIRGIVRITKLEKDITSVRIVASYDSMSPGDGVMKFELPAAPESGTMESNPSRATGMIVDLEAARSLVAQRHIVYVDWGREDGIHKDSRLEVFRVGNGLPRRIVGELRIVALEDHTATAQVVNSLANFLKGDRFTFKENPQTAAHEPEGAPEVVASATSAKAAHGRPIELEQQGNRLTINLDDLVDQLVYESGEVSVKPTGVEILQQLYTMLKEMPDKHITVEGHADNVPIGPSLKAQYPTNRELSAARAKTVVRYLVNQGGLDPAHVSAIGVADKKPVASNTSEEGRRKNRRIEIVLTPVHPEADTAIRLPNPQPEQTGHVPAPEPASKP
jgi:chemotaxis protein MotB